MDKAKTILMEAIRKMRVSAQRKQYEADKLNKQADELEKTIKNNIENDY